MHIHNVTFAVNIYYMHMVRILVHDEYLVNATVIANHITCHVTDCRDLNDNNILIVLFIY